VSVQNKSKLINDTAAHNVRFDMVFIAAHCPNTHANIVSKFTCTFTTI